MCSSEGPAGHSELCRETLCARVGCGQQRPCVLCFLFLVICTGCPGNGCLPQRLAHHPVLQWHLLFLKSADPGSPTYDTATQAHTHSLSTEDGI